MLATSKIMTFVATTNPGDAKHFYGQVLGLRELDESPGSKIPTATSCLSRRLRQTGTLKAEPRKRLIRKLEMLRGIEVRLGTSCLLESHYGQ